MALCGKMSVTLLAIRRSAIRTQWSCFWQYISNTAHFFDSVSVSHKWCHGRNLNFITLHCGENIYLLTSSLPRFAFHMKFINWSWIFCSRKFKVYLKYSSFAHNVFTFEVIVSKEKFSPVNPDKTPFRILNNFSI